MPASPHLAAALEGVQLDSSVLLANARAAARGPAGDARTLILEGVGGLLVPLAGGYAIGDLASDLGLPVVIAARPGLGTINHTLLTIEAARSRGLRVAAVVLNRWPEPPGVIECSNRDTIAELGQVDVLTLGELAGPRPRRPPGGRRGAALARLARKRRQVSPFTTTGEPVASSEGQRHDGRGN